MESSSNTRERNVATGRFYSGGQAREVKALASFNKEPTEVKTRTPFQFLVRQIVDDEGPNLIHVADLAVTHVLSGAKGHYVVFPQSALWALFGENNVSLVSYWDSFDSATVSLVNGEWHQTRSAGGDYKVKVPSNMANAKGIVSISVVDTEKVPETTRNLMRPSSEVPELELANLLANHPLPSLVNGDRKRRKHVEQTAPPKETKAIAAAAAATGAPGAATTAEEPPTEPAKKKMKKPVTLKLVQDLSHAVRDAESQNAALAANTAEKTLVANAVAAKVNQQTRVKATSTVTELQAELARVTADAVRIESDAKSKKDANDALEAKLYQKRQDATTALKAQLSKLTQQNEELKRIAEREDKRFAELQEEAAALEKLTLPQLTT